MELNFAQLVQELSTEELKNRISNYDQWQEGLVFAAKQELKRRNEYNDEVLYSITERKDSIRAEEEKSKNVPWLITGFVYFLVLYILLSHSLLTATIVLIAIALISGSYLRKIRVSTGNMIFKYSQKDRSHFKYLIVAATVAYLCKISLML